MQPSIRIPQIAAMVLSVINAIPAIGQQTGQAISWGARRVPDPAAVTNLVAVAAGYDRTLGLREDGSLVNWGAGTGRPPSPTSGFVAVACGPWHCLALRDDGSIAAWGESYSGACEIPSPNSSFAAIAGGGTIIPDILWVYYLSFSLGLKCDGSLRAWGDNYYGQCDLPSPNQGFIDVAAAGKGGLALRDDGVIVTWGAVAPPPEPNADFVDLAAGQDHFLGLKADGSIVAWGTNDDGQCDVPEPNGDFVAVAAAAVPYYPAFFGYSLGLKADGSIVAWGSVSGEFMAEPAFVSHAAGSRHAIGLRSDGTIEGLYGSCNIPVVREDIALAACSAVPRSFPPRYSLIGVSSGGELIELATGQSRDEMGPFTAVTLAAFQGHALREDGSILTLPGSLWQTGQVPEPNEGFVQVAAFGWEEMHTPGSFDQNGCCLGLREDGSLVAWGDTGILTPLPEPNADWVSVSIGSRFALGLKADGSIIAWGDNYYGQCDVPAPNEGFVAVDVGTNHGIGLRADGSIACWGLDSHGQCQVPEPNADFVAVAAGQYHSLGLRVDGTILSWGWNGVGECDIPEPNSNWIGISADARCSMGIRAAETVIDDFIVPSGCPTTLRIRSLQPNPFNPVTTLDFETQLAGPVVFTVHDIVGRQLLRRELGPLAPGQHRVQWRGQDDSGRNVASGCYLLQLAGPDGDMQVVKGLLVR
jgi:alpha-tubulin suppressor-like RCC1 family protein